MQRIRKSLAISMHLAAIYFAALLALANAQDWPTFRHDNARTGTQPAASDLSDPKKVPSLSIKWTFPGRSMVTSGPFVNVYAGHNQQHFAYLTANGDIWDAFYCPGCSGNGWLLQKINDGGVTTGPPAIAGPFIDTYAEHDQQHFAYLGDNGDIWDAFYCPGCSGDQWRLQKINNGGATSAPAAVAAPFVNVYSGNDQQHFVYLAANGDIWDAFYCAGCSGNPWRSQKINNGGVTSGPPAIAGPFVDTYTEHDQQHFAYLAKNGEIWDAFYCPGCSGDQWRVQKINNGGVTGAPPAVGAPFVDVFSGHDQQHFAYLAANGDIWDAFYCPGCSGNAWRSQKINNGGVTSGPPAIAGPFIDTYTEHDQQHFVYLAKNGEIWDAFYCPGCSGNPWRLQKINNGGATTAPAAFTLPFVDVYSGNDQQHFAYLATDGEIWDAFYCPGCSGNPWRSQQIDLPPISPTPSGFSASPIVVNGTVFIGDNDGYFYALDAATGFPRWQFPAGGNSALLGGDSRWRNGINSSAAYWDRAPDGAVIFAAQDPTLGPFCPQGDANCAKGASYGSSRLFALNAKTGAIIWKSDVVAEINGDTIGSDTEIHQRIHYSPPLIFDNKVYIGVHSYENPIQIGRVIAVDLTNGHTVSAFQFQAVGTPSSPLGSVRGGGVWNGAATDGTSVFFTTGNTNRDGGNPPLATEPPADHGVSMVSVNKDSGKINFNWPYKPVPYSADCDADWSAGATVMKTSCGSLVASVQKDGWSYAIDATQGPSCPLSGHSWQFPPTTKGCSFPQNSCPSNQNQATADHGDDDYRRPGAAWDDVFVVRTGGESRVHDGVTAGYSRLHALNACATTEHDRVRWIADIPSSTGGGGSFGAATVTGGIVFVGTNQGHLVVLADPSVSAATGSRCSNIDYPTAAACTAAGYSLVPIPKVIANIQIPDGGSLAAIRNEPVLAEGRVFVGTNKGHVYMLQP